MLHRQPYIFSAAQLACPLNFHSFTDLLASRLGLSQKSLRNRIPRLRKVEAQKYGQAIANKALADISFDSDDAFCVMSRLCYVGSNN
jgi:hypothetical protein